METTIILGGLWLAAHHSNFPPLATNIIAAATIYSMVLDIRGAYKNLAA